MKVQGRRSASSPIFSAFISGAALSLLCAFSVSAQTDPGVSVSVEPPVIHMGDVIEYTVTISIPREARIEGSRSVNFGGTDFVELERSLATAPSTRGRIQTWNDVYRITRFATGEATLPPVSVRYRLGEEEPREIASGAPLSIRVESIHTSMEMPPLAPLRPFVPLLPRKRTDLLFPIAIVAAGILLALLLFYLLRDRKTPAPPPPPVPAHITALQELDQLRIGPLIREHRAEEFSVEVSGIIRRYIFGRFGIPSMDRTSEETLADLSQNAEAFSHLERFRSFFESCDLVKFARGLFQWENLTGVVDEAEELVHTTEPCEIPQPSLEPGPDANSLSERIEAKGSDEEGPPAGEDRT